MNRKIVVVFMLIMSFALGIVFFVIPDERRSLKDVSFSSMENAFSYDADAVR